MLQIVFYLSAILFSCLMPCNGNNDIFPVNSSFDLEQYLCNTIWSSQYLVFLLNSSVNYTISPGEFCQVATQQKSIIEIRSDSSTESANITCVHNDTWQTLSQSRRGLVFFNSQVTLKHLVIKNCGTYLTTIQDTAITEYLNSSSLYYTSSHAAALVFVHCQVIITQVNIYYSYGFAMIGVNLNDSSISEVNISYSSLRTNLYRHTEHKRRTIGCGALLHFFDHQLMMYPTYVTVNYAHFKNNFDLHKAYPYMTGFSNNYLNIVNAAGMTVLYTQKTYFTSVTINNTEFTSNVGSYNSPGGLLVLHYNSSLNTSTIVDNSLFSDNANGPKSFLHGAALALYWIKVTDLSTTQPQLLLIQNTNFYNHTGDGHNYLPTGAVYCGVAELDKTVTTEIHFKNCSFQNNLAQKTGACLFMSVFDNVKKFAKISILLEDIYARNNSQKLTFKSVSTVGIFSFSNVANVSITGTSTFTNNYGSVIDALNSNVYLSKYANVTFSTNVGSRGAAIKLLGNGYLYFIGGAVVNFTNNGAHEFGGAVYASSGIKNSLLLKKECIIQLINITKEMNISFTENVAINAGNSIYAYPLFSCRVKQKPSNNAEVLEFYKSHFHFIGNKKVNKRHNISTSASKLTLCYPNNSINIYPGQRKKIYMASIDALNRSVYSTVSVTIAENSHSLVLHNNQEQILNEGNKCTSFEVLINRIGSKISKGMLVFSLPSFPAALVVNFTLLQCPLGFVWQNGTHQCGCSSAFYNNNFKLVYGYKADCDIDYLSIVRPGISANAWAGYMNTSTGFGVSIQCPLGYCNGNGSFFCSYQTGIYISKYHTCETHDSLCLHHRVGPLCGSCNRLKEDQKLSVVFGSTECRKCSNWWLWTLVLYAVAGPLLIYLLFALRITLTTGTFNGIIFYAQTANVGIIDMLSVYNGNNGVLKNILITLLSFLNLGLGFPLCLYDGMTELWKAGLNLLFPLYLLTIVVVLIIFSHFSLRLSNRIADSSVQVLVTVVHLSFGRLLGAIINTFTPAKVFTSEHTYHVWYWDGSVEYGSKGHIALMIITSLVVLPLLLSYVLLLLFAKSLRHWTCANEYTRPIVEAIHAPYKNDKQYWFVARLLLLIMMYLLYSIEPYQHTIYIVIASILVFFMFGQAILRPYKSKFINMLDCWLLFNLVYIYFTIQHLEITVYSILAIFLFFMTFFVVLVCHLLFITGQLKRIERKVNDICTKIYQYLLHFNHNNHYHGNQRSHRLPLQDANDSFYSSCDNFREPMLGSN